MALTLQDAFDRILKFQKLSAPFFRRNLHLFFDGQGRIRDLMAAENFPYPSLAAEFNMSRNIGEYFDFRANLPRIRKLKRLFSIRGCEPEAELFVRLRILKNPVRPEDPEMFFTGLPIAVITICRVETGLYYGLLQLSRFLPNTFPQRPNGMLFIDKSERLAGFNETFLGFFARAGMRPEELLYKPVGEFLSPTPVRIQADLIKKAPLPDPHFMTVLYDGWQPQTIEAGRADSVITLPPDIDTRRDFMVEMEFRPVCGSLPLLALGDKEMGRFGPDVKGYLVGPHISGGQYAVKRKGVIQWMEGTVERPGRVAYRLHKVGQAFILDVNNERKMSFCDLNFLHKTEGRLSLYIRNQSACRIEKVRILQETQVRRFSDAGQPITRLRTPGQEAFIVSPMDCPGLSSNFPEVRAYSLDNVTEMQVRLERLEEERRLYLSTAGAVGQLVGESPRLAVVREIAGRVARSDATVLIQGETGTGKEVVASYIHRQSARENGPFVKVDCSTIPRELMESELFGHEKGAFTGAAERRLGHFERADQGTLFLDEIGNLSLTVQAKLLHFMQDRTVTRVGGRGPLRLDVRIIVASNVPLQELVGKGAFRQDLYYRIEVVTIDLPPLRERREDIPDLCRHFIRLLNNRYGRSVTDLSPAAYEKLFAWHWPGNIRELKNVLERAVIFSDDAVIPPERVTLSAARSAVEGGVSLKRKRPLKGLDAAVLGDLFRRHGGVAAKAAAELGVSRRALYYRMKSLGLSAHSLRRPVVPAISPA